jgi:hypothetical protein
MFNASVDFEITGGFSVWAQYSYNGKSLETSSAANRPALLRILERLSV